MIYEPAEQKLPKRIHKTCTFLFVWSHSKKLYITMDERWMDSRYYIDKVTFQIILIGMFGHSTDITFPLVFYGANVTEIGASGRVILSGFSRRTLSLLWNSRATRRRKQSSPGCTSSTRNINSWSSTCRKRNSGKDAFTIDSCQRLLSCMEYCIYWTFSTRINVYVWVMTSCLSSRLKNQIPQITQTLQILQHMQKKKVCTLD